jgi:cold shock CspA family protein
MVAEHMQVPLEVTFRGMEPSAALESEIHSLVKGLEHVCDRITSCHVTINLPHRHQRNGKLFEVKLLVSVPQRELAVSRHPEDDPTHADANIAVRDAFRSMRRKLEDYVREIRGDVKAHDVMPHGEVAELFPLEGYGFIKTREGRRIYFHRNAVLDGRFDELDIDSEVTFVEEEGDKGPQASTVRLTGRRR